MATKKRERNTWAFELLAAGQEAARLKMEKEKRKGERIALKTKYKKGLTWQC